MGASIAWHAARRADPLEEPVVLLERKALAAGSSGRSGAILRQHDSDLEVAAMARDSLRVYSRFERATGRSIGFQKTGVLTLAGPGRPDLVELVTRNVAMQVGIGIDTRLVEAAEIRRMFAGIEVADGSVGAWEPGGGGVDPVRTVEALAALAREQGASTRIGVQAAEILVQDGRVRGVATAAGPIEAEQVVVAAGPWTRALLLRAGVDLPLRVVRPEQHFVSMPPAREAEEESPEVAERPGGTEGIGRRGPALGPLPPAAHPVILDLEHGFYARCETHGSREGLASPRTRGRGIVRRPVHALPRRAGADRPDPGDPGALRRQRLLRPRLQARAFDRRGRGADALGRAGERVRGGVLRSRPLPRAERRDRAER